MPRQTRLNTPINKQLLRGLFLLYDRYKHLTWNHIDDPRSTTLELNAVYRNTLVPKIESIVDTLQVGPNSSRQLRLKYHPLPFRDLFSVQDDVRESKLQPEIILSRIAKVQAGTKDLLDEYDAEDVELTEEILAIIREIDAIVSPPSSVSPTVFLQSKPRVESKSGNYLLPDRREAFFFLKRDR